MDDELLELQRQFEFAQQAKSSMRLSERNVVELVQKLQELRIIDFDLLHTVSGREYITPDQLRREIANEIKKRGRISLIDLAESTAVDLYHVEKQAQHVVANDSELTLIQGEIISQTYWDSIAEEINERLQECSEIALSELATQLQVSSETIVSMLEPRLGTLVKGRLEGGQLYTPAYVARVTAMVRGASRGITIPTNVAVLWSSLQKLLLEMDGASGMAVEGSFYQSIFNNLIKEGSILGSLRAGVHWTPTVFSLAQKECVESFYSQNSFISYEGLQKLGIPNPIQFMQSRYPEGIPLVTTFVHRSMIDMLDATAEDTIEHGSWISSLSVLPSSFGSQDASKLLSLCPSVKLAIKSNKAVIFGDSYLFSNEFIKDMHDRLEKEMETSNILGSSGIMKSFPSHLGSEVKRGEDSCKFSQPNETANERQNNERVSKKKKGKSGGTNASNADGSGLDDEDHFPAKSKKNQKKSKDAASLQVVERKASGKRESDKSKDDNLNVPSKEWVMEKIKILVPDFEEQGVDDPLMIIIPLTNYFQPMLVNSLKERRKTLFSENADRMKRLLDNLQRNLDEAFLNLQLYEKALDLFDDDQSASVRVFSRTLHSKVILHRHLLRTTAASIADMFFVKMDLHNKIKNGMEVEESQNSESVSLSPGERTTLAQNFPGSLSSKALTVVEALEGKRVSVFVIALGEMAEESGLHLKKLDKKLERTLLHSYRKDLTYQVSAEVDPVSLLPKVVSLLYIQIHHKALQAPGRAISVAVSRLKENLDESRYKILSDYQAATVTFLALVSAAAGDEDGCSSDRILSKKELLESQMQALKGLVLTSSQS